MDTDKNNFSELLKQAQEMQKKLQDAQKTIENLIVTGESGAGLVKVEMTGRHDVRKITIDDSVLKERAEVAQPPQPQTSTANKWATLHNKKEVLEDLIAAAFNDAVRKIEKSSREQMTVLAQGLKLPPEMGGAGGGTA